MREKLYKQTVAPVGAGRKNWRNFQELCKFPEKDTARESKGFVLELLRGQKRWLILFVIRKVKGKGHLLGELH